MKSNSNAHPPETDIGVSELPPDPREEITINARLLNLYVGFPQLSYESWAAALRHTASQGHNSHLELTTGTDGELSLNARFATYLAWCGMPSLMSIIALILIDEGRRAAENGDADYANRMLHQFRVLASACGQTQAKKLHAFLEIEQICEQWIAQLQEKHDLKYWRNYVRVSFDRGPKPLIHPKDTGEGDIFFGPRFALELAAEEPTPRGRMIRSYIEKSRAMKAARADSW